MFKLALIAALLITSALLADNKPGMTESGWKKANKDVADAAIAQARKLTPADFKCDVKFEQTEDKVVVQSNPPEKFDITTPGSASIYSAIFGGFEEAAINKRKVYTSDDQGHPYQVKIETADPYRIKNTAYILKSTPDKQSFSAFKYAIEFAQIEKRSSGPVDHPQIKKVTVLKIFVGECKINRH